MGGYFHGKYFHSKYFHTDYWYVYVSSPVEPEQPAEGGGHYIHQRRFEKPKKKARLKKKKLREITIEELLNYERFLERFWDEAQAEKEKVLSEFLREKELWDVSALQVQKVISLVEEKRKRRKRNEEQALIALLLAA